VCWVMRLHRPKNGYCVRGGSRDSDRKLRLWVGDERVTLYVEVEVKGDYEFMRYDRNSTLCCHNPVDHAAVFDFGVRRGSDSGRQFFRW